MFTKLRRWIVFNVVFGGGLLALSGEWGSPLLWTYLIGVSAVFLYALMSLDPELASERFHPPTRGADATALRWIRITAIALLVISPLDRRFHWSPPVPDVLRIIAMAGSLVALVVVFRA